MNMKGHMSLYIQENAVSAIIIILFLFYIWWTQWR